MSAGRGMFAGRHAVVVGFGASGRSAAWALLREGASVRVSEARAERDLGDDEHVEGVPATATLDVDLRAGGHRPDHLDGASLVVVSPGVPEHAPILRWASERGLPIWSELEVGARLCRVPHVAVTGTNGKTTTVEMIASAMRAAGLSARACGNVGYPFSVAAAGAFDALAVEASSFQLRFHHSFRPRVSVLLNLAEDHLDWHGSFAAYSDAKARIHALQGPGDVHVGNRDDPTAARVSAAARCEVRWFRPGPPGDGEVGLLEGRVVARRSASVVLRSDAMHRGGGLVDLGRPASSVPAFLADAAAAAAAGLAFGLPQAAVTQAIETTEPLPHRGGVVAEVGSVRFVDDSKATNPHAALASLEGRTDVVLVAGGLAKGVDLSPLLAGVDRLAGVVAIGEAAGAVAVLFEPYVRVVRAASIEEAVEAGFALAPAGGTVLLAPACASQDMFPDYRDRGERFTAAARSLAARMPDRSAGHSGSDPRRTHAG